MSVEQPLKEAEQPLEPAQKPLEDTEKPLHLSQLEDQAMDELKGRWKLYWDYYIEIISINNFRIKQLFLTFIFYVQ